MPQMQTALKKPVPLGHSRQACLPHCCYCHHSYSPPMSLLIHPLSTLQKHSLSKTPVTHPHLRLTCSPHYYYRRLAYYPPMSRQSHPLAMPRMQTALKKPVPLGHSRQACLPQDYCRHLADWPPTTQLSHPIAMLQMPNGLKKPLMQQNCLQFSHNRHWYTMKTQSHQKESLRNYRHFATRPSCALEITLYKSSPCWQKSYYLRSLHHHQSNAPHHEHHHEQNDTVPPRSPDQFRLALQPYPLW